MSSKILSKKEETVISTYRNIASQYDDIANKGLTTLQNLSETAALLRLNIRTNGDFTSQLTRAIKEPDYKILKDTYLACEESITEFLGQVKGAIIILESVKNTNEKVEPTSDELPQVLPLYDACQLSLPILHQHVRFLEALLAEFAHEKTHIHAFTKSAAEWEKASKSLPSTSPSSTPSIAEATTAASLSSSKSLPSTSPSSTPNIAEATTAASLFKDLDSHKETALSLLKQIASATKSMSVYHRIISNKDVTDPEIAKAKEELIKYANIKTLYDTYNQSHTAKVTDDLARCISNFAAVKTSNTQVYPYVQSQLPQLKYLQKFFDGLNHRFYLHMEKHTPSFNYTYAALDRQIKAFEEAKKTTTGWGFTSLLPGFSLIWGGSSSATSSSTTVPTSVNLSNESDDEPHPISDDMKGLYIEDTSKVHYPSLFNEEVPLMRAMLNLLPKNILNSYPTIIAPIALVEGDATSQFNNLVKALTADVIPEKVKLEETAKAFVELRWNLLGEILRTLVSDSKLSSHLDKNNHLKIELDKSLVAISTALLSFSFKAALPTASGKDHVKRLNQVVTELKTVLKNERKEIDNDPRLLSLSTHIMNLEKIVKK